MVLVIDQCVMCRSGVAVDSGTSDTVDTVYNELVFDPDDDRLTDEEKRGMQLTALQARFEELLGWMRSELMAAEEHFSREGLLDARVTGRALTARDALARTCEALNEASRKPSSSLASLRIPWARLAHYLADAGKPCLSARAWRMEGMCMLGTRMLGRCVRGWLIPGLDAHDMKKMTRVPDSDVVQLMKGTNP